MKRSYPRPEPYDLSTEYIRKQEGKVQKNSEGKGKKQANVPA